MPRPAFGIANVLAEGIWQPLGDTKVWSKTYRVKQGPCCAFIGLAAADGGGVVAHTHLDYIVWSAIPKEIGQSER